MLHRVAKNVSIYFFAHVLVKYEPISIKIGRHVLEETLNKIMQKLPTSHEISASTTLGNLKCKLNRQRSIHCTCVHFIDSLSTGSCKQDWQLLSQQEAQLIGRVTAGSMILFRLTSSVIRNIMQKIGLVGHAMGASGAIYQVNQKKSPLRLLLILERSNIHFITKFY